MNEEIGIWRAAKLLVNRHGDEAPVYAAMRAEELLLVATSRDSKSGNAS